MADLTLDVIADLVKQDRAEAQLSLSEYARNWGVDRAVIVHLENHPEVALERSWPVIQKVATEFGLDPDGVAMVASRETRAIRHWIIDPKTRDARAIRIAHRALVNAGYRTKD